MSIVITAFERSPDRGRGLARDTRVRWALEEVGQSYEVRLVSFEAIKARASGTQSIRPDSDLRGRQSSPVRDRSDRIPHCRAPCRSAAG